MSVGVGVSVGRWVGVVCDVHVYVWCVYVGWGVSVWYGICMYLCTCVMYVCVCGVCECVSVSDFVYV